MKEDREVSTFKDLESQERQILDMIRYIGFGEIQVTVRDGIPVRIDAFKRSIKL